jgi:hypothetical protein
MEPSRTADRLVVEAQALLEARKVSFQRNDVYAGFCGIPASP